MTLHSLEHLEDDFFAAEAKAREAADDRVQPWQAEIAPGQFVLRGSEAGIAIYSEVLPPYKEDPYEGEDEDELPEGAPTLPDDLLKNYRFSKSYSVACTHGELGDFHVCTVVAILTAKEFETARSLGWPTPTPR